MLKNKYFKWGVGLIFLAAAIYSLTMNQKSFEERTAEDRAEYLETLKTMDPSPVGGISGFTDFNYYPADEKFVVTADFEEVITDQHFTVFMTDGSTEELEVAGEASFKVNGQELKVTLYDEGETLLLPFTDLTNDKETYGGGRYVNVVKTNNNKLQIDFNDAHNFYCAYNESFICPVPPAHNDLKIAITAGEKNFK